jgi:hypothetical protein
VLVGRQLGLRRLAPINVCEPPAPTRVIVPPTTLAAHWRFGAAG